MAQADSDAVGREGAEVVQPHEFLALVVHARERRVCAVDSALQSALARTARGARERPHAHRRVRAGAE